MLLSTRVAGRMSSTSGASFGSLVSPAELVANASLKVKFLDGSWSMNKSARNVLAEFESERLPGARFFDIDAVSDTESALPHMIPTAEVFADAMTASGINNDDHVVVYTTANCFSACRVWWTLRAFGHEKVSILDGGLEGWRRQGGKLECGPPPPSTPSSTPYVAKLDKRFVVDWKEVLSIVETGSAQICDARSRARYLAEAPEPRAGLVGGHIPGSLSVPFTDLVKQDDPTTFRSKEDIRDALVKAGVVFGSRVVVTCGSGVTACVIAFCLELLGKDLAMSPCYDGSWSEWGDEKLSAERNLPIVGK